jgi:hypothetical protein
MAQDLYLSSPNQKKPILILKLVVNPCGGASFCGWNNAAEGSICTGPASLGDYHGSFKAGKLCHSLPNSPTCLGTYLT